MLNALDIHVTGIVQGVGFRPFVYRLAKRHLVNGWVLNAVDGVHIHAEGEEKLVDEFVMAIHDEAPVAASVKRIDMKEVPLEGFDSFEIRFSNADEVEQTTLVSPDLASCDDCVAELFESTNRRYRYPFINCTNCGPRFTIIDELPYDRAKTSMRDFEMCEACAAEYADPADRRFHAQPDACFDCGPQLSFSLMPNPQGNVVPSTGGNLAQNLGAHNACDETSIHGEVLWAHNREESDEIIAQAVELLAAGKIVAIKGLGGFHLVCDATNAETLAELRRRKKREGKAFAVMVPHAEAARNYCELSPEEEKALTSPARPIVLLKKKPGVVLAEGLADELPELGIMLPATSLQHLVLHDYAQATGKDMLVFTSGNTHDEPIQIHDEEARVVLAGIADALVGNNRAIRARYDDSVVRVLDFGNGETAIQLIRRARGYAPSPLMLGGNAEDKGDKGLASPSRANQNSCIFATGPEQKNTFCFLDGQRAFVSQHLGDMENLETFDAWLESKAGYEHLFELSPALGACDMHPEYLTSKWAADQSLPFVQVQHHHAHIVSAMAEHGLEGPVLGVAFDGTGYGPDGAIWGGEVLLANLSTYERFANFAYFPLPGGAAAIKYPLRAAYGALWAFDLLEHPGAKQVIEALGEEAGVCEHMIEQGINTPYTSSVGRLFDAASAILGLCSRANYEGEPAILLSAALDNMAGAKAARSQQKAAHEVYEIALVKNTATETSTALDTSVVLFDAEPLFRALLDDLEAGVFVGHIARKFHDAFVAAVVQIAQLAQATYDIHTVVLSGGVFMNRYLCEQLVPALAEVGFTVAMNKDLPPNDGCISFGQAVGAWHQNA